ncbi:hypothetical protein RAS1_36880 [Phycisphaerae bacterium RAS1]|nr:hypothetical protein RAS1_36880 [Phycisphaerae bacterium RAS1]
MLIRAALCAVAAISVAAPGVCSASAKTAAAPTRAQRETTTAPASTAPATTRPTTSALATTQAASQPAGKPKAPPPYLYTRFEEDYRWLDSPPGTYATDFTDALKNVHLGENWRLSIGGEMRLRWEYEKNKTLLRQKASQDKFLLERYWLWGDLRLRDDLRFFVEGETEYEEGVDLYPTASNIENRTDLKQLFGDFRLVSGAQPLTLRLGRQELTYGNRRILSSGNFSNLRRRFDAVKLMWRPAPWDVDVFWGRPLDTSYALGRDKAHDRNDEDTDLFGVYSTFHGIPKHTLDAYIVAFTNNRPPRNANGVGVQQQIYTIGGRFEGKQSEWDYEVESALQTGEWGDDQVAAWFLTTVLGHTFEKAPMTPRLWTSFEYASGDRNPVDHKHESFNRVFPSGHSFFGAADLVGRSNIIDPQVGVTLKPLKNVTFFAEHHLFYLAREKDALYAVSGSPTRRDRTGDAGRYVGHEIDLKVQYALDRHSAFEAGYSHFEGGSFLQKTGPERAVEFVYVQYTLKF